MDTRVYVNDDREACSKASDGVSARISRPLLVSRAKCSSLIQIRQKRMRYQMAPQRCLFKIPW